jgi:hypothetical protein
VTVDISFRARATDATGATSEGVIVARFHDLDPTKVGWPDQDWLDSVRGMGPVLDGIPSIEPLEAMEARIVTDPDGLSPFRERDTLIAQALGLTAAVPKA